MNRNVTIAAAVAAALYGGAAFAQQGPTTAQITSSSAVTLNIMGSSAIKGALLAALQNTFCGGVYTNITSSGNDSNFLGVSCVPAVSTVAHPGSVYNIMVRYEGGSVTAYLPVVNNTFPLQEINPASLTGSVNYNNNGTGPIGSLTLAINGDSTTNGADDSFQFSSGGSSTNVYPDLGIGDVEASALIGNNYPSAYLTSVYGPNNQSGLYNLKTSPLVDEVYALFVNENSSLFTETPLNLSLQTLEAILQRNVTNWSNVVDVAGNAVVSGSLAINLVNRETGSGSRAATDILIVGDGCGAAASTASIQNKGGNNSTTNPAYFSTGDVLNAANSVPGAISYGTIDNYFSNGLSGTKKYANLTLVTINNVVPSNLNAALGTYPFWVEAQYINNTSATGGDSQAVNTIASILQNVSTTAQLADINAIPGVTSALTGQTLNTPVHLNPNLDTGTGSIYINPWTRSGKTCSAPTDSATIVP
jgi:hypothetical protein